MHLWRNFNKESKDTMEKIYFSLDKETRGKLEDKAQSLGMPVAVYLRNLVQSDLKRSENMLSLKDLQKGIMAIVVAVVHVLARTQKATPQQREAMEKIALSRWKEYFQNEEISDT